MGSNISPNYPQQTIVFLTDNDPPDFDQKYVENVKKVIEKVILPLFDKIHSLDDVIQIAEKEEQLPQEEREFFPNAIYSNLALFYAYKGWKEKALETCDKYIETTPITSQDLAEKDKKNIFNILMK
jgi:hypothetical protein